MWLLYWTAQIYIIASFLTMAWEEEGRVGLRFKALEDVSRGTSVAGL